MAPTLKALAFRVSKTRPAPGDPGAFPPDERLVVVTLASSKTEDHQTPDSSWSLEPLAFAIVNEAHHRAMSRSTIQRILASADLKPHQSVYWLNRHDPDFDAKAQVICRLYVDAPRLYQQGRLASRAPLARRGYTGSQRALRQHQPDRH